MRLGLKFRYRIVLPTLLVAAAALVATVALVRMVQQTANELAQVELVDSPALDVARELEAMLLQLRRLYADTAATESPAGLDRADRLFGEMLRRLDPGRAGGEAAARLATLNRQLGDYHRAASATTARLLRHEGRPGSGPLAGELSSTFELVRQGLADHSARAREDFSARFDRVRQLQFRTTAFAAGLMTAAALLAQVLAWWLAAGVARPLEALQRAARRIADGDLTVPIDTGGRDEVGALAESLSLMQRRLHQLLTTLRASASDLTSSAAEMEQLTNAQIEQLERQALGVSETTTTTRELDQASAVASSRAGAVREVAARAAAASVAGQDSAARSVEGIEQIQGAVARIVAASLLALDQARAVGEMVESVKDLAARSHVLSLNASIEAVRAGEAGRGFAVVATEVRALAEQSGAAATRIGRMVAESLGAIETTLDLTQRSRAGMEGSLEAVRASGLRLAEIGGIVRETGDAAGQIAAVVQQQSLGVAQIATAMRDLDAGMEETLARIQGLERAALQLKATSTRVSELVGDFKIHDG